MSAEPPRYLLLANPTSGTDEDRALIRRASDTLGDVQARPVGPGNDPAPDMAAAVSAIVELREARPFALDGELQSPVPVLAVPARSPGPQRAGRGRGNLKSKGMSE